MSISSSTQTKTVLSSSRRKFLRQVAGSALGAAIGGYTVNRINQTQMNAPKPTLVDQVQVPPVTLETASGVRVHAIQTGYVAVKQAHRQLVGFEAVRLLSIALDTAWTEWMPINTWVIEHPEGLIVVDTGETSQINTPGYFNCDPVTNWVYSNNLRFAVTRADEIGSQLQTLNLDPADVRFVVQTHLHSDHMGGIKWFPNAQIYVPKTDYPNGMGTLSCHFPPSFAPRFTEFTRQPISGIGQGYRLTRQGDVTIVPTHGHSLGHQSVLFNDGTTDYLLAGDTSFDEAQLRNGVIAGIVADVELARATLNNLRALVNSQPTIYLPTHDADSRTRFLEQKPTIL